MLMYFIFLDVVSMKGCKGMLLCILNIEIVMKLYYKIKCNCKKIEALRAMGKKYTAAHSVMLNST